MRDVDKSYINEIKILKTRCRKAEKRVREIGETLRLCNFTIASSVNAIALCDLKGIMTNVNNAFLKMWGYKDRKNVLGKSCMEFWQKSEEAKKVIEILYDKGVWSGELNGRRKDGQLFYAQLSANLVRDNTGKAVFMMASFVDITECKRAMEALLESNERFRNLTETTSDWIWEVDEQGIYTYTNPKVKELLGYEPEELIGKTPFDLMPPEEAKHIAAEFKVIMESRKPFFLLENTNLHKDGRPIVLETSGVPIFDVEGNFRGYRGIDRDITKRKQTEIALIESKSRLQEQKSALERKNIALHEIIDQIEIERKRIQDDVVANVNNVLFPILEKLKMGNNPSKYINVLQYQLEKLTSSYSRGIINKNNKLTPREVEICNLILGGLVSKDIAKLLNISYKTVETHRKKIRHKLGLSNKNINLVSYLREL